ncbi:hypothetical protein PN441_12970 [Spirulina major CS-329]|uniref:DUF6978 family protein n=1 Tax=Spirulina TaxID=1154 RepID=UPI00232A9398|nr:MULTISPECIES: hypothetical protein [Spirulina]MDB9493421.1 hypothetical protein [Spirulina subsalsa CS-330]MDB9503982.1 hypothetical protein [Spirulina major CS-329]
MLTQAEFETLINDPAKVIDGDITWTQERSPRSGFRVEILSPAGYPLFLKGSYNPIIVALSYHIIHRTVGRIYGLDLGKDHRNPNGQRVGEKHKHRWRESLRDKEAYIPPDITAPATEPVRVWEQFCQEAKIHHNGSMDTPPPTQLDLFL